jgi:hypothetical protein
MWVAPSLGLVADAAATLLAKWYEGSAKSPVSGSVTRNGSRASLPGAVGKSSPRAARGRNLGRIEGIGVIDTALVVRRRA